MPEFHEPLDADVRAELSQYDDLTAALLARRGITTREAATAFMDPSYDEHIHDPLLLKNMPEAAARLAKAIREQEHIAVWSDYDCDGIPGGVILHDFLKKAGANFENYIPHRHEEGYGVNEMGIEKLAKNGATLVVTVDSGITDIEAVAHARKLGMDVIVTDHHIPGPELPDAIVVDHKQKGETYPFPELCGAAMAWKLACATLAVDPTLREKIPVGWEKWLLDMAGLATIADMMPLTGENRVLVKYGLMVLRKSPRVGLQKLCKVMRVNQRFMMEDDVAFMLAPRVNAASRMGDPRDAFTLFTTDDEIEAEALAKKLEAANRGRRSAAAAITRGVHEKIAERLGAGPLPSVIVAGDPDWKPALLGLVASNIAEEFERPVFLWGREASQTVKGSCRSYGNIHMVELMTAAKDGFIEFGGHAYSGGFTLTVDQVFTLEEHLVNALASMPSIETDDITRADVEITSDEATLALLAKLSRLQPFGMNNPKPIVLLRNVVIGDVSWFGKTGEHLKISIPRTFDTIEAISFYAKRELGKKLDKLEKGKEAHLLVNLERDQFSKKKVPRLRIVSIA